MYEKSWPSSLPGSGTTMAAPLKPNGLRMIISTSSCPIHSPARSNKEK
jgi:hypothetical protein